MTKDYVPSKECFVELVILSLDNIQPISQHKASLQHVLFVSNTDNSILRHLLHWLWYEYNDANYCTWVTGIFDNPELIQQ